MEVPDGWRRLHPKQPGLLMVQMDAAPLSTAAVASSRPREDPERGATSARNGPQLVGGSLQLQDLPALGRRPACCWNELFVAQRCAQTTRAAKRRRRSRSLKGFNTTVPCEEHEHVELKTTAVGSVGPSAE